ncbi:hypothetical protein E2562_015452 [Oryza meyeriana var. granulata]|uniref:DUF4220 domain-containing protein n=1 Tax=Oryza meyeriana var. granulata TaxID=110450 RepID=A0A6G1BXF4_9ORYZ|nr:hypothetical protein E2562_015452 [Oryza meyeriana var. granulata]
MEMAAVAAAVGVLLPFPFYWALWNHPQRWVDLCGRGADPCRRMAQVSHVLKYVLLWCLGYVFMMWVENKEDPATRAKLIT